MLKKGFLLAAFFLSVAIPLHAQITTAAIGGEVTDAQGRPVIGATVTAVHEPSGTRYAAAANADGRYVIRGMRAGGPYRVEIACFGMVDNRTGGITLRLGETFRHDAVLEEASLQLGEIVVTSRSGIENTRTGAASSVTAAEIGRMPSIAHGIADAIRLNPHVRVAPDGTISFNGINNRYNSFRIDGVINNDAYGLADNGFNGGQAGTQPVSMETVEQLQISVAPFDVRQSGFTGGTVNAITRSGTNDFHGSVYGFGNNRHLIGRSYRMRNGASATRLTDRYEYRAGLTAGGPVVADKLFFFVHYERAGKTYRNPYSVGAAASMIDAGKAADVLQRLSEMAAEQGVAYRGTLDAADVYAASDKAGVRLDWNLSDRHKASFRWSLVSARQLNGASDADHLNASSFSYDFVSLTDSYVLELQSRLSNSVSNEFRVSCVRVRDRREPGADPFPMVQVGNVGDGTLNLGNDRSSMVNRLDQTIWSFTDNLTWYVGKHALIAGTHNEFYRFSNLFIQDAYGSYFFDSPDDFYAGNIRQYRFAQANTEVTGDPRWAAAFGAGMLGFYIQDNFGVSRSLDLSLGIRVDIPLIFGTPAENAPFNEFMVAINRDCRTDVRMGISPLFSPRFGFRWNIRGADRCVVRGGAGIFTGRIPFVWLSNNFANTGVQFSTFVADNPTDLPIVLDPAKQAQQVGKLTAGGSQTINVADRAFVFPQDLRADLAVDFGLGGFRWTAEVICSKTLNDVFYRNIAVEPKGRSLGETYPSLDFDRRPMLGQIEGADRYNGIYLLGNTHRGYTCSFSLTAQRSFDFGLDITASYTWLRSVSANNGTTAVAASNWQANYTASDPNIAETGYSPFHIPHSVHAAVFYTKNWNANHTTTIGLTYAGSSGIPYSVCYNGDLNGDGAYNDLLYIPTDAQVDRMRFTATADYTARQQQTNFKAWLARDGYTKGHRGEYYRRNGGRKPFENHFDFHFAHRINFRIGKAMRGVEFSLDLVNVGNLFCKAWGRTSVSTVYYNPVTYKGGGNFQFLHDADYDMHAYDDYYSRWRGQLGVRFIF